MPEQDDVKPSPLATQPLHARAHQLVEEYQREVEKVMCSSDDGRAVFSIVDRWAAYLLHAATEIASPDVFPHVRKEMQELFDLGEPSATHWLNLITQQLSIKLGRAGAELVRDGTLRVWKLYEAMNELTVSPRAAAFLERVSRCYIFGLDSECIIVCRSVLDVEFDAEISADDCATFTSTYKRSFSLDDRIRTAARIRRITPDGEARALRVKGEGNVAVHSKPSQRADALPIILDLVRVLSELLP